MGHALVVGQRANGCRMKSVFLYTWSRGNPLAVIVSHSRPVSKTQSGLGCCDMSITATYCFSIMYCPVLWYKISLVHICSQISQLKSALAFPWGWSWCGWLITIKYIQFIASTFSLLHFHWELYWIVYSSIRWVTIPCVNQLYLCHCGASRVGAAHLYSLRLLQFWQILPTQPIQQAGDRHPRAGCGQRWRCEHRLEWIGPNLYGGSDVREGILGSISIQGLRSTTAGAPVEVHTQLGRPSVAVQLRLCEQTLAPPGGGGTRGVSCEPTSVGGSHAHAGQCVFFFLFIFHYFSHFHFGSMYDDICLHAAWSCTSPTVPYPWDLLLHCPTIRLTRGR